MQRQRYLIIQNSRPRVSGFALIVYFVVIALAALYFYGFFYLGTQELDSETRIEGRQW